MEDWTLKINKRPNEIIEKLEAEINAIGGFVFDKKTTTTFSFRKRILYAWYMPFQNWTIVSGKLSGNTTENATNIKISFHQHFLIRLVIYTHIILGLGLIFGLFFTTRNNLLVYVITGLVIALGVIIWTAANRKFKKDIEKYKGLINDTFRL